MKTKSVRIKILKRKTELAKGIVYNLMEVVSATAEHDRATADKVMDSITIPIPNGVTQIQVEALASNEINIFYREKDNPLAQFAPSEAPEIKKLKKQIWG